MVRTMVRPACPHRHAVRQALVHAAAIAYASSVIYFFEAGVFRLGAYMVETGVIVPLQIIR